ncbi:hypothetical protein ACJ73_05878, partial [Blastomyces percursus]
EPSRSRFSLIVAVRSSLSAIESPNGPLRSQPTSSIAIARSLFSIRRISLNPVTIVPTILQPDTPFLALAIGKTPRPATLRPAALAGILFPLASPHQSSSFTPVHISVALATAVRPLNALRQSQLATQTHRNKPPIAVRGRLSELLQMQTEITDVG